jgi:hypothetical protein
MRSPTQASTSFWMTPRAVKAALTGLDAELLYVTASRDHKDHLDAQVWAALVE